MYIPKRYGESKIDKCPICGRQAITLNSQKIPVCMDHRNSKLDDLKCACGNYLETRVGKFGLYFYCTRCGNINLKRALELNPPKLRAKETDKNNNDSSAAAASGTGRTKERPREIIIRSDDPLYFD